MKPTKQPYYHNAPSKNFARARDLRKPLTPAEQQLWQALRNRRVGNAKFRRQHPVSHYIVDFYCHEPLLVIEVDGDVHLDEDVQSYDKQRQQHLESLGLTVLRFTNEEVLGELTHVLNTIEANLNP